MEELSRELRGWRLQRISSYLNQSNIAISMIVGFEEKCLGNKASSLNRNNIQIAAINMNNAGCKKL